MATNLAIDDNLIKEADALAVKYNKKEAIATAASDKYIRRRKQVGNSEAVSNNRVCAEL